METGRSPALLTEAPGQMDVIVSGKRHISIAERCERGALGEVSAKLNAWRMGHKGRLSRVPGNTC